MGRSLTIMLLMFLAISNYGVMGSAELSPNFYDKTCPNVTTIIRGVIARVRRTNININALLSRLHFHDCFVNGCDGSVLLDPSPADGIEGERGAVPNQPILRGLEVVDEIKTALETACPGVVSCADILALASELSVEMAGGPSWAVPLGRRDSRRAIQQDANDSLPTGFDSLDLLMTKFSRQGFDATDLVLLTGGHTIGEVRCGVLLARIYNFSGSGRPDPTLNPAILPMLRRQCPQGGNRNHRTDLDPTSPNRFDNKFFKNLRHNIGLMTSDQVLYSTPGAPTRAAVNHYANNQKAFFDGFVRSMIKMGNMKPLTGKKGEIRRDCKRVNKKI